MPNDKELNELDAFFKRVELRHKQAAEAFFIDDLKIMGGTNKAATVNEYLQKIDHFRNYSHHQQHFETLLESPNMGDKLGSGALAALIGAGTDALTRFASKRLAAWTGLPNPIDLIEDTTESLFKGSIAVSVGKSLYKHWTRDSDQKISYQAFEKKLRDEGFNNAQFNELSKQLMVIFHYRECLLLGIKDDNGKSFRKSFLDRFFSGKHIDEKALTIAIEMYFLGELKRLFSEMFEAIYQTNSNVIEAQQSAKKNTSILKWFDTVFKDPNKRENFSQQMEYDFMINTVGYLQTQISQPSTLAKYPKLTASTVGLVAGTVALGIAWAVIGGPFTMGIAAVGLLGAALFGAASYFAIKKFDILKFKRNKSNRKAIQGAVDAISEKSVRLKQLIDKQLDTDPSHIKQFNKYNERNTVSKKRFISHYILGIKTGNAAAGSEDGWKREYVARHRHNILIEAKFKQEDEKAILAARGQTQLLQQALLKGDEKTLGKFIEDTTVYLAKKKYAGFIRDFEIREKIREQVLDIVSVRPDEQALPAILTDFYFNTLGGHPQVFALAQAFKPHDRQNIARRMSELGGKIDTAKNFQSPRRGFILSGDSLYRKILNLQQTDGEVDEINDDNIGAILQASYEFLWSLNHHPGDKNEIIGFDEPVNYSPEFMLYRTLLMTQLAKLVDLNRTNVNNLVRDKIRLFVEDKFDVDPDVIFNDIANQSLLFEFDQENPTNNIADLCSAVRLDLAYTTTPVNARHLIEKARCADDRLNCESQVFGLDMPRGYLTAQMNQTFAQRVTTTITNTETLIDSIIRQAYLDEANEVAPFVFQAKNTVENLQHEIASKLANVIENKHLSPINKDAARSLYSQVQSQLDEHLRFLKSKHTSLRQHIDSDELKHQATIHNSLHPKIESDELRLQRTTLEDWIEEELPFISTENSGYLLDNIQSNESADEQNGAKKIDKRHHGPAHSLAKHISRGLHRIFSPSKHHGKKEDSIDLDYRETLQNK